MALYPSRLAATRASVQRFAAATGLASRAPIAIATRVPFIRSQRRDFHQGEKKSQQIISPEEEAKDDILFNDLQGGQKDIREYLHKVQAEGRLPNIDPIKILDKQSFVAHGSMLSEDLIQDNDVDDHLPTEGNQYDEEEAESSRFLSPGDLVNIGASGDSDGQLAIYVRSKESQQQFYTIRGNWRIVKTSGIDFIHSQAVPPELLLPIIPYFPDAQVGDGPLPQIALEGGVPRSLGAPLIVVMRDFEKGSNKYYRKHYDKLDGVYDMLAHETEFRTLTMDEIIRETLGKEAPPLSEPEKYAFRKAILRHPYLISANCANAFTESYTFQPKQQAKIVRQVIEWVQEYQDYKKGLVMETPLTPVFLNQNPMKSFITKAKQLIEESRQNRTPTPAGTLSPCTEKTKRSEVDESAPFTAKPSVSFSEDDMKIISYIRAFVLNPAQMKQGSLRAAASFIVQATDMYEGFKLNPASCFMFLQEIGIFRPWENRHLLSDNIQLPGHGISQNVDNMVKESNAAARVIVEEAFNDQNKDIRTDWGSLPVFCVDAVEAAEIDDGFSIEPAKDLEGGYWIRVHVANPSAYIPPESPTANSAAYLKRSFYTPERVYPMLPNTITHQKLSLAQGRPTITFSAKINDRGDIVESDVRSGIINNVVYFTPAKLRELLGVDNSGLQALTLSVGETYQERTRAELLDTIPAEHHDSLRKVYQIMEARRARRNDNGALDFSSRYPAGVSVYTGASSIPRYSATDNIANHYVGDPTIRSSAYITNIFEKFDSVKNDIVSHIMLLAGEVAGKWCAQRGIPAIFSGTLYHPEFQKVTRETLTSQLEGLSAFGMPKGFASSTPVRHEPLGMEQYLKATSPLRRFTDLLAHWQIEAALRFEDKHGRELKPAEANGVVPFERAAVDALIDRGTWQNLQKDQAQKRARTFWICQLLSRAFHHGEGELPRKWQCLIKGEALSGDSVDGERRYVGSMLPHEFPCIVSQSLSQEPAQAGDLVEVELEDVNVYDLIITTKMNELITRPPFGPLSAMGFVP